MNLGFRLPFYVIHRLLILQDGFVVSSDESKLKPVIVFCCVFVMFDLKNTYFQHVEKPLNRKKV